MTTDAKVLVVGAGISGYAAAISLARAGHQVTMLDRELPGPDRLGESLDWETPNLLDKLGISFEHLLEQDEATIKAGAVASHAMMPGKMRVGFHPIYRVLMALVGRTKQTYHVDRAAMTRTLHERAVEAGVQLIEARVVSVETQGDRIVAIETHDGVRRTGDHFVDSTGRARLLAKALGVGATKIGPAKLAISTRLAHQYDHLGTRIRLDDSLANATWMWDINIGETRTDLGVVFAAQDVAAAKRGGSTISDLYQNELRRHEDLGWARQVPIAGSDLDRVAFQDQVSDRLVGTNWVLAGESAAVIDPLLSSGVSFALRSGISAANVTVARLNNADRGVAHRHDAVLRSHALTVNTLLDELWYKSRLRMVRGFSLNVFLLLVCNFNLNHLQARWFVQTRAGAAGLIAFHRVVRRIVPALASQLEARPARIKSLKSVLHKPTKERSP